MSSLNLRTTSTVDMGGPARRKRDIISPIVRVKSAHLLLEMRVQEPVPKFVQWLKECFETDNSLHQVNLIKQIGLALQKNRSTCCEYVHLCIKIFVEMYFQAESRHIAKRTIASTFQTLPVHHHHTVIECLRQALQEDILFALSNKNTDILRHLVDNIMSCLENFNLGTQCISDMEISVLRFINIALETFRYQLKSATCPTIAMKATLNCQMTVRTLILILQKCAKFKPANRSLDKGDCSSNEILRQLIDNIVQLLVNEENSLDCRCNCGMVLPLLIPLNRGPKYMEMIFLLIFSNSSLPSTLSDKSCLISNVSLHLLNISTSTSKLCLAIGFLASLETQELLMEIETGITLFFDILLPHIMSATKQSNESAITVVTSRAVLMWTKRAKEILQEIPDNELLNNKLKGDGDISCQLLGYVWTHWEHFIDSVRHTTRDVFDNVIILHILSSNENPTRSPFIKWLVESLLKMPLHQRGKYNALCCLVDHFGAKQMLHLQPNLPDDLLKAMGDQALISHATELMETLFTAHKREANRNMDEWERIWLMPVIIAISEKSSNTSHLEHLLSKLLKCSPSSLNFIISELVAVEASSTVGHLRAIIITAKTARTLGLVAISSNVPSGQDLNWNDIFPIEILQLALCHVDDEIRLDAFALLCDTPKTSEFLPPRDLDLIRAFLPYNMNNQSPSFRQKLLALVKKLIIRINEGGQALARQIRQLQKKDPESEDLESLRIKLDSYQKFITWLCNKQTKSLHPGANFPRRGIALNIMKLLHEIIGFQFKENELSLYGSMDPPNVQTLLECLKDTYETNKIIALNILKDLTAEQLGFTDLARVSELFDSALQLASRFRPTDCVTAAYLFRLLVCHSHTWTVAVATRQMLDESSSKTSRDASGRTSPGNVDSARENPLSPNIQTSVGANGCPASYNDVVYVTLEVLTFQLMVELEMAKGSLLEASANGPMYGVLFCIRSLLQDLDFRTIATSEFWQSCITMLIGICLEIGDVVDPVVNNSSPEGYLPIGTDTDELTQLQTNLQKVLGHEFKNGAQRTAPEHSPSPSHADRTLAVTAQMLLLCGWRTMKEISLILGDICQRSIEIMGSTPDTQRVQVSDADVEPKLLLKNRRNVNLMEVRANEFVSVDQIFQIGNYFITLLAETKHRGAFEQAYVGFCKVCDGLWRSSLVELHQLPQRWLQELFELIQSGSGSSNLCSTRRSAGLPFMVQALVSSEPDLQGSSCFRQAMVHLLEMALSEDCAEDVKVHGFNILRALYRDTRLGDDVTPYVADGIQAAILGFRGKTWSVRNSATLLFSALITRIFGVKRSRDELSKKNCLTATVFFQRFPSLYQFLLDELKVTTSEVEENHFGINIQPSLYPILLILARLYPSSIEGTQSTIKLSSFVPFVRKCGQRPVMNTRILAAKALVPLVPREDTLDIIKVLLESLPDTPGDAKQNALHGTLLQIFYLLQDISNQSFLAVEQDQFRDILSTLLKQKIWIASRQNCCPMTRCAFLEIVDATFTLDILNTDASFCSEVLKIVDHELSQPQPLAGVAHIPGKEMLQLTVAKLSIQLNLIRFNGSIEEDPSLHLEKCVGRLLCHDAYEVRWTTLQFLYNALFSAYPSDYKLDFRAIAEMTPLIDPNIPTKRWTFLNEVNSKQIVKAMESEELMVILITMACSTEKHFDCLAQLYHLLTLLPKVIKMEWPSEIPGKGLLTCTEKMEVILQKGECEPRDDIRSALLHFLGFLIPHVYDELYMASTQDNRLVPANPKLILAEFTEAFLLCCSPEQSLRVRLTATLLLIRNAHLLLLDPKVCLGTSCQSIWSSAIMLLRDDEPFIKTLASNVVEICSHGSTAHENLTFDTAIQPALALDILIGQFVSHFGYNNQSECLTTLLDWMLRQDVQDGGFLIDEEERMFDRGQMNIYAEEIDFTDIVQKHFKRLLQNIFQPDDVSGPPIVSSGEIRTRTIANLGRRNSKGTFNSLPESSTLGADTFQGMSQTFKGIMGSFKVTGGQVPCWIFDAQKDCVYGASGQVYLQDIIDMLLEELSIVLQDTESVTHQTPFMSYIYDQTIVRMYRLATAVYCLCKYDNGQRDKLLRIQAMLDKVFGKVEFRNRLVRTIIENIDKLCTFHNENDL